MLLYAPASVLLFCTSQAHVYFLKMIRISSRTQNCFWLPPSVSSLLWALWRLEVFLSVWECWLSSAPSLY